MKVFTVGLDDKEKSQKAEEMKKEDMTKVLRLFFWRKYKKWLQIPIDSSQSTPAASPGPIIIPRGPPKQIKGCGGN